MRRISVIPAGRGARFPALVTLLLLASLSFPALADHDPVSIRVTDVELAPYLPTYLDPVSVTVRGFSNCLVSAHEVAPTGNGFVLKLDRASIVDPPLVPPVQIAFELPRAIPGERDLRVAEEQSGGALHTLWEGSFTVHRPGHFVLEAPDAPITDDAPATVRLLLYGPYCPNQVITEVTPPGTAQGAGGDEGVIDLLLDLDCVITTPPPVLVDWDQEVGPLPAGDYVGGIKTLGDRASRGSLTVYRADGCIPSDTVLCLNDDRFRVSVTWRDFEGKEGDGVGVPIADRDDTGMFWFFRQDNVELTVKVLNGCGVNGHFWVFASPGSTVEWTLTVTDTVRDRTRTYRNGLGEVPSLIPDTTAFHTCP